MTLSTTVDATYGDDPANPSQKQHQQDHDVIHAVVNGGPYVPRATGGSTATAAPAVTLNVKDYGAVGNGVADDSAAFAAVANAAKAALRTMSQLVNKVGSIAIDIPAGDYKIVTPNGLLGVEGMTEQGWGLRYRGAGRFITNIVFTPAAAGSLVTNDYWQHLTFTDMTFFGATAGCTFMNAATTHAAQRFTFDRCGFWGFHYNFNLTGTNNNSEWVWTACDSISVDATGANLFIGAGGSDQFLNFWWYGCKHWSTNAPFIDAALGGHFNIYGLDCSDWGGTLSATGYLFNLRGTSHGLGVCMLNVDGLRVEAKNANAALIYNEWPQGPVTFRAVDWSSQAATYTYGNIINAHYVNVPGAGMSFHDSRLAGGVVVSFDTGDWSYQHRLLFDNCDWMQKDSPSDVVTYDVSRAGGSSAAKPPVEFRRCRGNNRVDVINDAGATWDATIGYNGELLQTLEPRCLSVRDPYGLPRVANPKIMLPVGALITSLQVISPSGAVTEADGGSWTLATTEVTPTTVATVTVSGAMSAGFSVESVLSVPFLCDTKARATLTLTAANVAQSNSKGLLLVKGYW